MVLPGPRRRAYTRLMSSSHVQPAFMTLDEYLTFEEASDRRHEYVNGQVHAMVGVTRSHSRIAGNIAGRMWEPREVGRVRCTTATSR
jgi:Uma2 family endonuclease